MFWIIWYRLKAEIQGYNMVKTRLETVKYCPFYGHIIFYLSMIIHGQNYFFSFFSNYPSLIYDESQESGAFHGKNVRFYLVLEVDLRVAK